MLKSILMEVLKLKEYMNNLSNGKLTSKSMGHRFSLSFVRLLALVKNVRLLFGSYVIN